MTKAEMKELLREAWKEVFETEEVSDDADFFEEGGDSIKAVQLSSWLVQKGVKLDLGKIFYTPVFSELAETLEETEPMYVPDRMMDKELIMEKYQEVINGAQPSEPVSAPAANNQAAANDQQICDPANNQAAANDQQICDPANNQAAANDQQICDPANNQAAANDQQICDPANNQAAANNQQICDPANNQAAANNQQICDPANNAGIPGMQGMTYMSGNQYGSSQQDMTMPLLQIMISQQQTMLSMMQIITANMQRTMPGGVGSFAPVTPVAGPAFGFGGSSQSAKPSLPPLPDDKKEAMGKIMGAYQSKKVDKPIDNPNVIKIKKAKIEKPTKSAEEALEYVLSTVLKNGLDKKKDLFEQGLSSLDTVKIVTRCGENGYELSMKDIYMHSVFDELVQCMVPGKE